MQRVFQITEGGGGGDLAPNLETAFRHVLHSLLRDQRARERLESAEYASSLAGIGAGGSFFHRVRREAELANRRGIDFIEHRLDAPPGHDSAVSWYGFDAFDPSFAVQNALYHAQDSDEESLDEIADNLCAEVTSGLRSAGRIMDVMIRHSSRACACGRPDCWALKRCLMRGRQRRSFGTSPRRAPTSFWRSRAGRSRTKRHRRHLAEQAPSATGKGAPVRFGGAAPIPGARNPSGSHQA